VKEIELIFWSILMSLMSQQAWLALCLNIGMLANTYQKSYAISANHDLKRI
jgi:hypothetical protein